MAKPRIGLTCDLDPERGRIVLREAYCRAILAAGGLPVLLPNIPPEKAAGYLEIVDGFLLTGGGDIEPSIFGARATASLYKVLPQRDAFELALTRAALAGGKPILAICRGIQVLNVAAGGDLYQDIPAEVPGALNHDQEQPRDQPSHMVTTVPGTRLAGLLGPEARVNSLHHQAVRRLGDGLRVAVLAPDGVIEGIEGQGKSLVLGVQWHPEDLYLGDGRQKALFEYFVEIAGG
ncbi:MAG: putative glutamine amidotransferase [Moorella sp. (in: firmicutes)]|uniref:Putative glutamine amidotransferasec n=1 Tax=Neomoorella thermoacetica TaxID=1525 RepID=A0A1J5NP23_NEOTH|nr:putative glutamine amidotransferase [Moorella sp. (in: firmicutes)]OIQ60024.1 putative glutamine amidotransferasec [Moorella thermoacetica]